MHDMRDPVCVHKQITDQHNAHRQRKPLPVDSKARCPECRPHSRAGRELNYVYHHIKYGYPLSDYGIDRLSAKPKEH